MQKTSIGLLAMLAALLVAAAPAGTPHEATKLPKCSGQLCKSSGCSPDVLCARGAAVVTCAEVCSGH